MLILTRKEGGRSIIVNNETHVNVVKVADDAQSIVISVGTVQYNLGVQGRYTLRVPNIAAGRPDLVHIDLIGIKRKQASLGVTAPKHIPVHRAEIQDRIDNGVPRR